MVPILLKPKEVAERLRITPSQVYLLVKQGKISAYRVNTAVRVSEDDLDEYLESRRMKAINMIKSKKRNP